MEAIRGIFDIDVYNLPTFEELDSNIDFQHLFLHNLIGSDYDCAKKFYDRIGEKLKKYFIDTNVISNDTCPCAYTIIITYKPLSGWIILTNLLKGRLVACGAAPDYDLDAQRCSLILREGDTLSEFFIYIFSTVVEPDNNEVQDQVSQPINPVIESFINEQDSIIDQMITENQFDAIDLMNATINSVATPVSFIQSTQPKVPSPVPFDYASSTFQLSPASYFTPQKIIDQIKRVHKSNNNDPHSPFLFQFSKAISSTIPQQMFTKYCKLNIHGDTCANVWAVNNREVMCFFIETKKAIGQYDGSCISSGWGGMLLQLNGNVYLAAPVYENRNSARNICSFSALKH